MPEKVSLGDVVFGDGRLVLIAGPCVIEDLDTTLTIADQLVQLSLRHDVGLVFKASYDKANRTSLQSFRGPGIDEGLRILEQVKSEFDLPLISDVHDVAQLSTAAEVLDILQIPAFLSRQTDLLVAAAQTGKVVNVKKGQFLAPWDMQQVVGKLRGAGAKDILLTERGTTFGYNNLVVDMRSLPIMRGLGCPVIFDATHAVQLPGGAGGSSGGQREYVEGLSRAAVAVGVDGLFWEVHPDPDQALCDGPNSLALKNLDTILGRVLEIHAAVTRC
ncbi:MAG: 3-deoxy-8-phosphooctulonate synthase [Desulfuromonas sp.]|nr:MAG: 3-deoxy-8-phosphooctulonate synthase [Desulfuromonas sp.]